MSGQNEMFSKVLCECQICNRLYQFGPNLYNGKHISQYQLDVCKICYESNADGWGPKAEMKFIKHLENKGIERPRRNDAGFFPRG